jgi:hypothetical protein
VNPSLQVARRERARELEEALARERRSHQADPGEVQRHLSRFTQGAFDLTPQRRPALAIGQTRSEGPYTDLAQPRPVRSRAGARAICKR